ncbi:MAG: hypothetical protein LBL41_05715 [Bifidobacteriaceae bacterium]|jgi:hypothetical protein|nr:hypothetical protein [Bifidobacteriaceae bacterium]
MEHEVIVLPSALKHGFTARDIVAVVKYPLVSEVLSSGKCLRIGLIGNVPVEILGRYSDDGMFVVFHCMKCRKRYWNLLESYYER